MRVLVTGGGGFIGSHVVERLKEDGHEPEVFDHRGNGNFLGDVRDSTAVTEAMSKVDGFIHLAGILGTQECLQNPRPAVETNILGGLNVLEAAAQYKVPGVCIGVGNHFMQNTYSITKSTVERFVSMYNAERGTKVNIVRAMNAYGPRQVPAAPYGPSKVRKIAPSFICRALNGDPLEMYGTGSQVSDMVYVTDVAEALVRSLYAAVMGTVFDRAVEVGPLKHNTVRQIAELVKEITGSKSEIVCLPKRPGEKDAPVYANVETLDLVGMSEDELVSLREGMEKTVAYYRGAAVTLQKLFRNRPDFITIYSPLIGDSMLEFGNKREGDMVYKHTFEVLGFRHVSIDLNGADGALKRDLRDSLSDLGQFDMVTNIGTSEHVVDNQEAVWRNLVEATKVGGVLVCLTPSAGEGNWINHGHWYPHEKFYLTLAELNGFKVEELFRSDNTPLQNTLCRMKKVEDKPFSMPDLSLFDYRAKAKSYGW